MLRLPNNAPTLNNTPVPAASTATYYVDSSSDSDIETTHIPYTHTMTNITAVEQSAPSKPPKLLPGELTPEVAHDWDNACSTYFMHKEVDAADQVKMIAFGMLDPRLHTWYLVQRAALDAGTFANYMIALKSAWLDTHWDTKLHKKVLGSQQGTQPFYEWALELQNQNALLYGNAAHLSEAQLRNQLKANICDGLTTHIFRARLATTLSLKEWIKEVKHLDDKCLEDIACHRKIAEDLFKSSRCSQSQPTRTPYTPRNATTSLSSSSRLGPLTPTERTLLMEHNGCFKCRKFYVGHRSRECTEGAPEASSYKTLTEADATAAKPKGNKKTVAAVAPIGAVMPSSVIEEMSESDNDTYVAPFETPHLIWPCLLTGPHSPSFECVKALIDHGSHLVLINEDLVAKLGLCKRKLHTTIGANSAFLNSASSSFSFSEYVHLSPSSINHDWHSHTIRTIIAPDLVVPLLLGGLFLSHNCLLIDHKLRTCIDKNCNYDLFNLPQCVKQVHNAIPSRHEVLHL